MAEKLGFLIRETVAVCPKSPLCDIFTATRLDFGIMSHKIRRKMF
jgi:hypothetical protein